MGLMDCLNTAKRTVTLPPIQVKQSMKKIVAAGILLTLIFLCYVFYTHYQHEERIRTALNYGHLAPLPATATQVKVDTEGNLFSRTFWLTFQANDAEINAWLKASPTLVKTSTSQTSQFLGNNPEWFTSQKQTETFEFTSSKDDTRGMVWIDRASKRVYVKNSNG